MGAYIDRDELLELYANTDELDISNYDIKVAVVRQNILDMPTIDLVRCGECEHSKEWYGDRRLCYLWADVGVSVFESGYCSYGDRRTDETIESITFKKMVKAVEEEMREVRRTVCSYGVPANTNQHTQRVEGVEERRTE